MANNAINPYKKTGTQAQRNAVYRKNLDAIMRGMDNNPDFYGVVCELNVGNRSYRINTIYGTVMYYLSSNRWQWKSEVHTAGPEAFIPWLAHFLKTGESTRDPERTTKPSGSY